MQYTEVIGCELRDFGFGGFKHHLRNALVEAADRVLHDSSGLVKAWTDEEPAAPITLSGREHEVVEVMSGRFILINQGAEYMLVDLDNVRQYVWIQFAEAALKEVVKQVPAHLHQRSIALSTMMALWA